MQRVVTANNKVEIKGSLSNKAHLRLKPSDFSAANAATHQVSVNGKSVDMYETSVVDGSTTSTDYLMSIFTSVDAITNPKCVHSSVQVLSPALMASRGEFFRQMASVDSVTQNTVAVYKQCSDASCGCDDPMANMLSFAMDNDVKSVGMFNCKCAPEFCDVGSTHLDAAGVPCAWKLSTQVPADNVCDAPDSASQGKKTCQLKGVTFSSNSVFGSNSTVPTTVRN